MKALTVWQPWASLIVAGVKPYEFRGRVPPRSIVGQRIAIHAGLRPVKVGEIERLLACLRSPEAWITALKPEAVPLLERWLSHPGELWRGAIVGEATLGKPVRARESTTGTQVNDSDRHEHAAFAWPMLDVVAYSPPIEARGAQGLWNWRGPGSES